MNEMQGLIYGANGYTGELVAREAVHRRMQPILAGRSQERVQAVAQELGLPSRIFDLEDPAAIDAALEGIGAVLHCAGPFVHTATPMVGACLRVGAHYLDITGEIPAIEATRSQDEAARAAGITLLPCVGFDVVPTDCLAARLAGALPDATHLDLAFFTERGSISRGTLKSMIEALPHAGAIRRDGKLVPVPIAYDAREIEFACGGRWTMTIPWGDLATAHHTTGIPNIRVYTGTPKRVISRARRLRPLVGILGLKPVKGLLLWWIGRTIVGPDAEYRARARTHLWGEVRNAAGEVRTTTLETPEGYTFTATAAVECLRRVLEGDTTAGFHTPAEAFGSDFVDSLPGVVSRRVD